MGQDDTDILRNAVARSCALVLSLPSAGVLRHHKSRFLDPGEAGFWIYGVRNEQPLIDELIISKHAAGVSFRAGNQKIIFTAPLLQRDPSYRVQETTTVEALLLGYPEQMRAIQRRHNYRVGVSGESELRVQVWRISERGFVRDEPNPAGELPVHVRNISLGGLGVELLATDRQIPPAVPDQRLRVEIAFRDEPPIVLEGRLRFSASVPPRVGVKFKKLQDDLEGRQNLAALTKIVGALQREEVRRYRLGMREAG